MNASTEPTSPPTRKRRLIRLAVVGGALFAVYCLLGFFAAPPLVRSILVTRASQALHREVTVAKVRVNPLALSVTIEGFAVKHRDGTPFVAWDSFYVRFAALRSLLGDVAFASIQLVRPTLNVSLNADGSLSFQDLLTPSEAPAQAAPPADPEKEGGLSVAIRRLAIEEARVTFRDATRQPAFDATLGPLTIRVDSFQTRGGGDSPYSFSGATDAGESFRWTGTLRTQPFRSAGTLAFQKINLPRYATYLPEAYPVALKEGLLDFETQYDLEWGSARRGFKLKGGKLAIDRFVAGPRGVEDAPINLPRIEVNGIDADALAPEVAIAEVALHGGSLRVRREADGALELLRMMAPPKPAAAPAPAASKADEPKAAEPKWSVGVVALTGLRLDVEDRSCAQPALLPLTDVQLRLEKLSSDPAATSPLSTSLVWNARGKLSVKGEVQPLASKGTLALDATDLDLVPFAPCLQPDFTVRLASGRAGAKLKMGFDASQAAANWTVAGDARLDALAVAEKDNEDLLAWRALEIQGIDARSTPPRASVRLIRLVEPKTKVHVWEDGATSLDRARAPAPAQEAQPTAKKAPAGPEWRTAIGSVQIVRGKAEVVDRSVTPPATLRLTRAEAKVNSLSSDPKVRSTVDVQLEVEGASPIRVEGTLNPLQKEAYTDLTISAQGVDLSPATPYSGKFLGYGIQKGKLNLDLRYKVENRAIAGKNVVKVDQFTFGDATNSPDATSIPVRLALALLKDKDGVVLIDVPVEGNLDDPEFHLGKVIWRTVLNLLVKVATSPFSALAAIAGADQADLSMVEFTPGGAEPLPTSQERFTLLAKSLAERPALTLELEGSADAELDGPALHRAAFERSLRRTKAATMRPPPASEEDVEITPQERAKLVRAAFDAAFPGGLPGRDVKAPPPTLQEMEEKLAARVELPPDAFSSLAAQRVQRARDALMTAGLDQARLFLAQGGTQGAKAKGARVYFAVR